MWAFPEKDQTVQRICRVIKKLYYSSLQNTVRGQRLQVLLMHITSLEKEHRNFAPNT
jgi:hypothetical protein